MFQRESLVAKLQHRSEAPEYGANDERNTPLQTLQGKPCAFDKLIRNSHFSCSLQFIFACTMVKNCAVALCRNWNKKRPNLSYSCFPTRPNECKKWDIFCKQADKNFSCGASVASKHQHNQDLRRIYKREYEFSNSSLFARMHCI